MAGNSEGSSSRIFIGWGVLRINGPVNSSGRGQRERMALWDHVDAEVA